MAPDPSYSIVYSNSRLLMEKSLEWARCSCLAFRASITDAERKVYNLNCTLVTYHKDFLVVKSVDDLALANVVRGECLLYIDSIPQSSSDMGTVAGKTGVFVCHTFVTDQKHTDDSKTTLTLSTVGRIEFRELRRFPRAASSPSLMLATLWRCAVKLPLKAAELGMPDFVFHVGRESNMEVMDVSAGGMRLRTPCEFGSVMPTVKGATLLCMFVLPKGVCKTNIMCAARVISCQPVTRSHVEIRLQFTYKMDGVDPEGCWQWNRLGQEGVVALRHWVMKEMQSTGQEERG